jgi:phospholipase C
MTTDRRTFLKLLASSAAATAFPPSIQRALAIPANHKSGTIEDVEHVVFLMQENRAFDHYFGTLRGVRGFGDPRAVILPSGLPVWNQPDPTNPDGYVLPFHPDAANLGLQFLEDTPHDWTSTHAAWNQGKYDQWVPNKGSTAMAYLTRADIPFHYALADAFTVCDAYYCSLLGPTDPNRYHMWTGWVGNDGGGGGPVVDNAEAGYDWSTYPERLERAGVSWKIYQDVGEGLDAEHFWGFTDDAFIGNYGDNSLLYFHQYQNAPGGSPLAAKARTGTNVSRSGTLFDILRDDVMANQLPQVSWIVAPEGYTEHGNWPANFGAYYVSQILDALTANPEVWSKTVLFLTYDENDGFFDHMVPPTPPQSPAEGISTVGTSNEIFPGSSRYAAGPYGFGVRVPMIVISPWTKGGWVDSEVFDHTSLIRFLERRFGGRHPHLLKEANITKWRRAVAGDLTSAFDFATPDETIVSLPSTVAYVPTDDQRHPDYSPKPPSEQSLPSQEPGTRPARAVPYELNVDEKANGAADEFAVHFGNSGRGAAVFHVRSGDGESGPWTYTVDAGADVLTAFPATGGAYDLSVYGPNGFLRSFKGMLSGKKQSDLLVATIYEVRSGGITLEIHNRGKADVTVQIADAYAGSTLAAAIAAGKTFRRLFDLQESFGWYDFTVLNDSDASFRRQVAGHVENGSDSRSDPLLGG